ncbi:MAG: diguanylate cyclase [Gemmatimonadota bacterium]
MHIYLVEVDSYARQMVIQHLQGLGHRVRALSAPADLLGSLGVDADPADLIVSDLPPGRSQPVCEALRLVHRRYPAIPVVLRVSSAVLPATDAVHCGVYAYLSKPFRPAELELLLIRLAERQASHSFQDPASGLYHRTGFAVLARQQLKAARRTKTQMILLRADVDGTNLEQTEHALGDLGRVVQRTFRDADMAGRMDGTDCGVLLVNAGSEQTDVALRRLQQNLAAHNARVEEGQQLKVRVGVAHFDPGRPCSFEERVAQADAGTPLGGTAARAAATPGGEANPSTR